MEETNGEIFLRTCTKHEDIGSKHSPRGNKDSCKVQKRSPSCVALHDLILSLLKIKAGSPARLVDLGSDGRS